MNYLRVKKWEEFQHYKDRHPPWIKLHRALLDDYEFARLPDASKAHLVLIWLLASQSDGRVPADPKFLQAKLSLDKQPDLQVLVDSGFLIPEQIASTNPEQGASGALDLARSREERTKAKEESNRRFEAFWLAYPRRIAKPDAVKAWKKLDPDSALCDRIMVALDQHKRSEGWTKDGGSFIPHPATWLNKQRFNDELALAPVGETPAPTLARSGTCECGETANVRVGAKWRCAKHIRGFEAAA